MTVRVFLAGLLTGLLPLVSAAVAASPRVVVSIAPLHSWVAQVSGDLWAPELLLTADADPHNASLRPSQRQAVAEADWLIWVGPELETGLADLVQNRSGANWQLTAADAGLIHYPFREAGRLQLTEQEDGHAHDEHAHDEHAHDEHEHEQEHQDHDARHEMHPGESHQDHADADDAHAHDHSADAVDPHLWLAPENARRALTTIAERLGELDPANRATYARNARDAVARLNARETAWQEQLAPVQGQPYLVFHDGYQYFDRTFNLAFAGSVTLNPEQLPGLATLRELRTAINEEGIACLFAESQYPDRLVRVLQEGSGLTLAYLDAQGIGLTPGPGQYEALMDQLVSNFAACQNAGS